jgi:molecular chaperone GrpE
VGTIPAPEESQEGVVIDLVQKGYTLNDKVIRFPKVIVGE